MNENQCRAVSENVIELVENREFKCCMSGARLSEVFTTIQLAIAGNFGHVELDDVLQCICNAEKHGVISSTTAEYAICSYVIPAREIIFNPARTE